MENQMEVKGPKVGTPKAVIVEPISVIHDEYAETIITGREGEYNALEIHGVSDVNDASDANAGTCFEVDYENPQMFSVYAHRIEGGVDCVGDFSQCKSAVEYANKLGKEYSWPVHNFLR